MTNFSWRRFAQDERGVSIVEFALLLPVMLLLLICSVTVFDLFRTAQAAEKGTFTVGDMLSRQTEITQDKLDSMLTFIANVVDYEGDARLRVTSVSNRNGTMASDWSKTVGNAALTMPALSFADLPTIAVGDSIILTEIYVPHRAFVPIAGLDHVTYGNRAVHRPRFVGKIAFR